MNDHAPARDPAAEAAAAVGDGFEVRVLEPSPPAVAEEPFWADDPPTPRARARVRWWRPTPEEISPGTI